MDDTSPVGVVVAAFGICSPDFGCTCEHHSICGTNVYLDMLVRFKAVLVDGGKTCCCSCFFFSVSHFCFFLFLGPHGCSSICGVYWVTEQGADRCLIGRVSPEFKAFFRRLEGRLGQVVTIFPLSNDRKKIAYSAKNDGVCHIFLVDRFIDGDLKMMECLDMVESGDSDSE